ncbi:hypothetical protein BS50DRAFT_182482 [Corynespora cassiicola Philippines]|uniref:Uncharacterized protein n=1 Tax=Corynespora cassiicola Philippines TaxID=1448308 RepID=A0A2T2P6D8_CORCC|nr:hypothetical protein BS50DRAFT_182482 [Corynespora cassiicola Philippines]
MQAPPPLHSTAASRGPASHPTPSSCTHAMPCHLTLPNPHRREKVSRPPPPSSSLADPKKGDKKQRKQRENKQVNKGQMRATSSTYPPACPPAPHSQTAHSFSWDTTHTRHHTQLRHVSPILHTQACVSVRFLSLFAPLFS